MAETSPEQVAIRDFVGPEVPELRGSHEYIGMAPAGIAPAAASTRREGVQDPVVLIHRKPGLARRIPGGALGIAAGRKIDPVMHPKLPS